MLFLTCEHGGNQIPTRYKKLFKEGSEVLKTHRGLDIEALGIAQKLKQKLKVPLVFSTTSRLVVDLNRTLKNPTLFSEFTTPLSKLEKNKILNTYYFPHWQKVRAALKKMNSGIVHVAVHSMTDHLNGKKRRMQLALLYNPAFKEEVRFSSLWIKELRKEFPNFVIARNKPYRGDGDGLTCEMRKENQKYVGIELEMNQGMLVQMSEREKKKFSMKLAKSLDLAIQKFAHKEN